MIHLLLLYAVQVSAVELKFNRIEALAKFPNDRIKDIGLDAEGYLWLALPTGLFRYDGYGLTSIQGITAQKVSFKDVNTLYTDNTGALWINSKSQGLYRLTGSEIEFISPLPAKTIAEGDHKNLWIGNDDGLFRLAADLTSSTYYFANQQEKQITSIANKSATELLIGTRKSLFIFNKETTAFKAIKLNQANRPTLIFTLHKDQQQNIWIGSDQGLFIMRQGQDSVASFKPDVFTDVGILAITSDQNHVWVGTVLNGLFKLSVKSEKTENYKHQVYDQNTLSNNSVTSLVIDQAGVLWINTFDGGVNYIDTQTHTFGLEKNTKSSVACIDSSIIYNLNPINHNELWISTQKELALYNTNTKRCLNVSVENNQSSHKKGFSGTTLDSSGQLWIATSKGLNKLNSTSMSIDESDQSVVNMGINFVTEYKKNILLLGTWNGVYTYQPIKQELTQVNSFNESLTSANIFGFSQASNQQFYFASNKGVLKLGLENRLELHRQVQAQLPTEEIYSVYINQQNQLWVGTDQHGLYKFSAKGTLLKRYNQPGIPAQISINSMQEDQAGYLWLGTSSGLIRLNIETDQAHRFQKSDGLQDDYFRINVAAQAASGRLFFGGRNGFNAFLPEQIKINPNPRKAILTEFTRFGKKVFPGMTQGDFLLTKPINELDEISLSHKDYVIGFEFASLDFADPSRNKFAYKMDGLDPDWNHVGAENRSISYSNLKSGDYVFKVKAANKDGVWNEAIKSLRIQVLPPPWFSWWAISSYILFGFLTLGWVLRRKNTANAKITQMLRVEVDKKTKTLQQKTHELETQKQTVETLLARKNELFANVSHEFRTPLTLIIGPVKQLLKSSYQTADINTLKMISRNANRLLTMIEQLLELAKIGDKEKTTFVTYKTVQHIESIVHAFQPLAEQKNITLKLDQNDSANIKSTEHAIEIVLGNLLSNAIKYTPINGVVTVRAWILEGGLFHFEVKDTGPGLDAQQKIKIFNRFKRLDLHKNVEGVGIGLSVVEEVLKVNNASIEVISEPGSGSLFKVIFEATNEPVKTIENAAAYLLVDRLTTDTTNVVNTPKNSRPPNLSHNESILIIDDNHDMRHYIADTLEDNYACLLAPSGKEGVALAIEHVPDIIICDVMMPEMDGFQVSRILRSDTRTSHIPLMLLTALDDKQSRIRGWREHVDVYLTKPFDENELRIQLENILVIRNILKRKAGEKLKAGEKSSNIDLTEVDQNFVNKLNQTIKNNFHNANYLRPQMASDMAVSVKQLQRKIKALIDKNPMDLLRDYRLEQSAKQLKQGHQVGVVSHNCGFNSLSYFSQCFKAQYGFSPKKYKQICQSSIAGEDA